MTDHAEQVPSKILHASRVESECAFRDRQYATREWIAAERVPFLRGSGAHKGREVALKHYLKHGTLPPLEEAQEAAEAEIEERIDKSPDLDPDEVEGAREAAVLLVEADYALGLKDLAPHVVAVEEELVAPIGDTGWSLTGRLDARGTDPVTGRGSIPDLKTADKSPKTPQIAADLSLQLTNYAILHQFHHGTIPNFALDYLWLMVKGPKADTVTRDRLAVATLKDGTIAVRRRVVTTRTQDDLKAGLMRLRFRIDSEEAGWHPPAYSGFMSACQRCPHFAHSEPALRCPWVPASRTPATEEPE